MIFKILMTGIVLTTLVACTSKSERDYMTGCVANGAPKELCECSYEKIKSMYSEEDFNKIEKGYVPADFMDKMVESTKLCVLENQ